MCCNQITKIFCTRYGSANASSARGSCNFGPLADLSNFGLWENEYEHCVYPNPHVSLLSALKKHQEKNWRESLPVMEFHHPPSSP